MRVSAAWQSKVCSGGFISELLPEDWTRRTTRYFCVLLKPQRNRGSNSVLPALHSARLHSQGTGKVRLMKTLFIISECFLRRKIYQVVISHYERKSPEKEMSHPPENLTLNSNTMMGYWNALNKTIIIIARHSRRPWKVHTPKQSFTSVLLLKWKNRKKKEWIW